MNSVTQNQPTDTPRAVPIFPTPARWQCYGLPYLWQLAKANPAINERLLIRLVMKHRYERSRRYARYSRHYCSG